MANTLKFGAGKWATGNGTALAYNDENNNFKPLPFTFTRDSKATVVNQSGLLEEVSVGDPRIDFLGNTEGAMLLEPSRSNNIIYSQDFSNSFWGKYNTTVTSGFLAPDGTNNAYEVLTTASGTSAYDVAVYQAISGQSTSAKTNSFFVKPNGQRWVYLIPPNGGSNVVFFDLQNGVIGTEKGISKGKIETYPNGWYRLSLAEDTNINYCYFGVGFCDGDDSFTYTQSSNSIFLFGGQYELGTYSTSYIKTEGGAVTRIGETCGQQFPISIPTSGTIYVEVELFNSVLDTASTANRYGLNFQGSSNDWIFIGIESGDNLRTYIRANGSTSFDNTLNGVFTTAGVYKIAMRFAPNDTTVFVNGIIKSSSSNTIIPTNLNQINVSGGALGGSVPSNPNKNRDFRLYNTGLSNSELQALTQV